jgi:predicted lipoprotein with Yx(FWY)xxD motif
VRRALDNRPAGNKRARGVFTLSQPTNNPRNLPMKTPRTLLLVAALAFPALALAQAPTKTEGGVLANAAGMTLYTFDKDAAGSGKSACNGPCATNWPPLMAAADAKPAGDYTIVTRDDGGKQWAFKGKPLYLWVKDAKPGDKTGDGVNKVWHVAKP